MTKDEAEIKQNEFAKKLDKLRAYPARRSKYIDLKESDSKKWKTFLSWMGENCLWVKKWNTATF